MEDLRHALQELQTSFAKIVKRAPTLKEYNHLLSDESSFTKSILGIKNADLEDEHVRKAVYIKELSHSGLLDELKLVLESDKKIDEILKANQHPENVLISSQSLPKSETTSDHVPPTPSCVVGSSDLEEVHNCEPEFDASVINSMNTFDLSKFQMEPVRDGHGMTIDLHDNLHKRTRNNELVSPDNLPRPPAIHDVKLLNKIFTHQSIVNNIYAAKDFKTNFHNERVEFLGDAFLQFVVTMIIYERFPTFNEGQLSLLRSSIVNNKNLIEWSKLYQFDKALKKNINEGVLLSDKKMDADVFEAYLGGLVEQYMMETEEGLTNMADFMKCWFDAKGWLEVLSEEKIRQFDSSLYSKLQYSKTAKQDIRNLLGIINVPEYIRIELPDHSFLSSVKIQNIFYGYGIGTSNKEADARAAVDAMRNPLLRSLCMDAIWAKYEDQIGINEQGGLDFNGVAQPISSEQLSMLKEFILIKYKSGRFKLLKSGNNHEAIVLDDNDRRALLQTRSNLDPYNDNGNMDARISIENDLYYLPFVTRGRGGVLNTDEAALVKKRKMKHIEGGIIRNICYELEYGEEILCHEVLVTPEIFDRDSKNKVNSIFKKRGGDADYRIYRTIDDEFLCELWFSNKQIVTYGISRTKKDASQLAAQLAIIREEFFGYED